MHWGVAGRFVPFRDPPPGLPTAGWSGRRPGGCGLHQGLFVSTSAMASWMWPSAAAAPPPVTPHAVGGPSPCAGGGRLLVAWCAAASVSALQDLWRAVAWALAVLSGLGVWFPA